VTIKAFPKIWGVGANKIVQDIFSGPVEITEKIDGSQFAFGKIDGELKMRSKGRVIEIGCADKMFQKAEDHVLSIEDTLPDNTVFYCEYLNKPKHNVLSYANAPTNNLVLFGVYHLKDFRFLNTGAAREIWADMLGIDAVPVLANNIVISNPEELLSYLKTESYLGKEKIEGVVVKNYEKEMFFNEQLYPIQAVKYVSEAFKERHSNNWSKENTGKGKWDSYKGSFCTEARWHKAIQHLRDNGELTDSPKDIGPLMKEIHNDITEEEKENIQAFLWKEFKGDLLRTATRGMPEWYKEYLLKESFSNGSA